MSDLPVSGLHEETCKFVCKEPKDTCEHACSVCALQKRCTFCHAPPGVPCRTVLYEEHVQYGNGAVHQQPHGARREQYE